MENKIQKHIIIKATDDGDKTITAVGSIEKTDRDMDVVGIENMDLKNYKLNPVVFLNHDHRSLPIGKAEKVWKEDNKLMFKIKFADETQNPMAPFVYESVKAGFLNALSIGFIPDYDTMSYKQDKKTNKQTRYIDKSELYEVSIVGVPANPSALVVREYKEFLNKSWEEGKLDGEQLKELQEMIVEDTTTTIDGGYIKSVEVLQKELQDKNTYIEFIEKELVELNDKIIKLEEQAVKMDNIEEDPYKDILDKINSEDSIYKEILDEIRGSDK